MPQADGSGGIYGRAEEPGSPQLTLEEIRAGVEDAHKANRKVTRPRLLGRGDHQRPLHRSGLHRTRQLTGSRDRQGMREEGKYLVPTSSTYAAMNDKGPKLGAPEYILRITSEVLEASRQAFRLAVEVGVKIAAGPDCGAPEHPHGALGPRNCA